MDFPLDSYPLERGAFFAGPTSDGLARRRLGGGYFDVAACGRTVVLMGQTVEYNPLDYANLTRNCVEELLRRGPFKLPLEDDLVGSGVYALFYTGRDARYASIVSKEAEWPIYVGKAIPPGGRKGGGRGTSFASPSTNYTCSWKQSHSNLSLSTPPRSWQSCTSGR